MWKNRNIETLSGRQPFDLSGGKIIVTCT